MTAAVRHLGFLNVHSCNGPFGKDGQYSFSCQISWWSGTPSLSYGNLSVFKTAAISYRGFLKVQILTAGTVHRVNMCHHAKFRADRTVCCGDMDIFRFFKMAAVHHIRFVIGAMGPPSTSTSWSLSLQNLVGIHAV